MAITNTITETLDKLSEQALDLVETGHVTALKGLDQLLELIPDAVPNPSIDADVAGLPAEVVDKGFATVEELLSATRRFVADVFAKVQPLVTEDAPVKAVDNAA